jgi:Uncharacterised nucleotidyltransferase
VRSGWLPDPQQALLLEAALADDAERAAGAWRTWDPDASLEGIDTGSFNLLPLVYRNLTRLEVEDPWLVRLRGVYRYTWSRNQLLMKTGADAIRIFDAAGIPTVVLKGAAITTIQFKDLGVRPMTDFDLLVPRDRAVDAIRALRSSFRPHDELPDPEARLAVHHSTSFFDPDDRDLDLHWYSLWQSAPDDDFWEAAIPIEIAGAASRALCPTDQLLHVLAHGTWWAPGGSPGWVADAITIIGSSAGGVNWERFRERAAARRLSDIVVAPLAYLLERFETDVPPELLADLARAPASTLERAARRAGRSPANPFRIALTHFDRYRRVKRLDPDAPRPPSFPAYMRIWLGYDSYREFSRYAGRRLLGKRRARTPVAG